MHKYILKLFSLLRDCTHFLKVVITFFITLFILYWIQNLLYETWLWLGWIAPFFDSLIEIGEKINSGEFKFFTTTFEYKYVVVLLFMWACHFVVNLVYKFINTTEDKYDDTRRFVKKKQEDNFNQTIEKEQILEQNKINTFCVYVSTKVKNSSLNLHNVDLNEQNENLKNFIKNKLGLYPKPYMGGFLYIFNNMESMDMVIDVFNKVIKSKAPLDYSICIGIVNNGNIDNDIDKIIKLKIYNKIVTLANVVYRYKFNKNKNYKIFNLGIYGDNNDSYEVHEFILE